MRGKNTISLLIKSKGAGGGGKSSFTVTESVTVCHNPCKWGTFEIKVATYEAWTVSAGRLFQSLAVLRGKMPVTFNGFMHISSKLCVAGHLPIASVMSSSGSGQLLNSLLVTMAWRIMTLKNMARQAVFHCCSRDSQFRVQSMSSKLSV